MLSYAEQLKVSDPTTLQLQSNALDTQAFLVEGKVPVSHFLT